MKIVTANLLHDGRVAYLAQDAKWTAEISRAALFDDDRAEDALAAASARATEVADVYLIDATAEASPAGRAAFRETIRSAGPTVRLDLGKQAGSA